VLTRSRPHSMGSLQSHGSRHARPRNGAAWTSKPAWTPIRVRI